MLVSVIVPCFNAARWIAESLQSVLAQDCRDLELIAIDDGSTDNTAEIIREKFSFVRFIQTPNRGVSNARNLGTAVAQGRFLQYLDADDLIAPSKLSSQVDALTRTGGDVAYGDWNKLERGRSSEFRQTETVARSISGASEIALFTDFWCPLAAYLFRREIVERVGGWNVNLPVIQDARFVLDCALQNAVFTYVPGVIASYRIHSSNSLSSRSTLEHLRDQLRNAGEIEQLWAAPPGITNARRRALLKVYGHIARASFELDRPTFECACSSLERLDPRYTPAAPRALAVVSRFTGYRRAEAIALHYRRAKRALTAA